MTTEAAVSETAVPEVYKAIARVIGKLALTGVARGGRMTDGGRPYTYRKIDDVYNAVAPLLASEGLVIMPRVTAHSVAEIKTPKGWVQTSTTLELALDFISATDASVHTVSVIGEARDSGDKGANKALSNGWKYGVLTTLCIPTDAEEADDERSVPTTIEAPKEKRAYPQAMFSKNIAAWANLIGTKARTSDQIISTISTVYSLTDDQVAEIKKA